MLVDLMVTVFLLAVTGVVFSATYPSGIACTRKAQDYKIALAVAQKKMEQLRAMNYESLTHASLFSAGVIDSSPDDSPYTFTQVEGLSGRLSGGEGELVVEDASETVRLTRVTVYWRDKTGAPTRSVTLTSFFTDKRTRRVI